MTMKKSLLLGASILLAGAAHAQLGLRAGANYATLSTKTGDYNSTDAAGRVGYQVGIFYEKKLNARFSVVPEVQYSHQTTDLLVLNNLVPDNSYFADYRLTLHYLNVPVVARAAFGKFYVEAGPQVGLLLAAHEKGYEDRLSLYTIYDSLKQDFDRSATDRYQRVDVGACAGAGVKLPGGFALGLRYSAGFLSIARELQPDTYGGSLRNQVVQAAVSYQL